MNQQAHSDPISYDYKDLKYCAPHGWGSLRPYTEYLKNAFDTLYAEGEEGSPGMMTVALHCCISGKPGRATAVREFAEYIANRPGVWVARRKDIAVHFREKFPYQKGKLI